MKEVRKAAGLRRMDAAEFERFRKYSVEHHAKDLERFFPSETACSRAEDEFDGMLPEGRETAGNLLMTIVDRNSGRTVGAIWCLYEVTDGKKQMFIADLAVDENEHGKGYASAALAEAEKSARCSGCTEAVLWVYADNPAALRLYEKAGYLAFREEEGGMYMKKPLKSVL